MQRHEAEENLRVIRSLMEKATIYRAISAPTALVGGALSSAAAVVLAWTYNPDHADRRLLFFGVWLGVLATTAASNALFIYREARRRGDRFISPGMKLALLALLPSHLTAAVVTAIAFVYESGFLTLGELYLLLPQVWCVLYGMGLMAMHHFAPRSISRLGSGFLIVGLLFVANAVFGYPIYLYQSELTANTVMGLTFGLFHLIYAALTWPRGAGKTGAN